MNMHEKCSLVALLYTTACDHATTVMQYHVCINMKIFDNLVGLPLSLSVPRAVECREAQVYTTDTVYIHRVSEMRQL